MPCVGRQRLRRIAPAGHIGNRLVIGRDERGEGGEFDGKIAQRHARFDGQRLNRTAAILDCGALGGIGAIFGDQMQRHVLGRHPRREGTVKNNPHGVRLGEAHARCRQRVLDLAGTDTDRQCAERAERACVRVRADQRHTRDSEALFRTHQMRDALIIIVDIEDAKPERVRPSRARWQ